MKTNGGLSVADKILRELERKNADLSRQLLTIQGTLLDKQEKFELLSRELSELDMALESSQESLERCQSELTKLKSGLLGRILVFLRG